MICRMVAGGRPSGCSPSAVGISGNSLASIPLMFDSDRPLRRWTLMVRTLSSISMRPACIELTQSVRRRAGRVTAPSSSIWLPSQQLTPTSRLVAASFRRSSSVLNRMLLSTGNVLREETARPTMDRPLARFSCMTDRRTATPPEVTINLRDSEGMTQLYN